VERWPIGRLIPDARNARTHSPEQVAQIAGSMREWGWTNPVLVDEAGSVIAGHGRILAARQLGFTEVPVMVAVGWTEAQRRAYLIADNQLGLNAGWDFALLQSELIALGTEAYRMADELKKAGVSVVVHPTMQRAASSMETLHRVATSIMIGEKAADMMLNAAT
jgi:ParB-like chromosome segregation protein Spo0J